MGPQHRRHRRVHRVPPDWRQGDPRNPEGARLVRGLGRRVGSTHSVRPGGRRDERALHAGRPHARAADAADWTDRVARGELPATAPSRPTGRERNVVITMWDYGTEKTYLHDEISSDKRNPDRQRQRSDLRRDRGKHAVPPRREPGGQLRHAGRARGPRSEDAKRGRSAAGGALGVLGRRSDLEQPVGLAQLRDGQAGACLGRGAHPAR